MENYVEIEEQAMETEYEPIEVEDGGSDIVGKIVAGAIGAVATFVAVKAVPKIVNGGKQLISNIKAKKELRQPDENKPVEVTDEMVNEATK